MRHASGPLDWTTGAWNAFLALRRGLARKRRPQAPEGVVLSAAEGRLAIGWLAPTTDIGAASVRYRCLHPARVLAGRGHANTFFTRVDALVKALPSLDAVVVVKRLDAGLVELAIEASARGTPLFLDLCDDLLSRRYGKNVDERTGIVFAALARVLSGVLVPSPAMAERVAARSAALGIAAPAIHVVPDCAETREAYDETAAFAGAGRLPPPAPKALAGDGLRRVVWFGNFGARNATFGILSLLPAMPVLAELARTVPLEFVVISNHATLFEALTRGSGVPARYVPWSAAVVYDALASADVALLTTGDDELSTVKSSNRTLQALAAGVPVVTLSGAALAEFDGIVPSERAGLRENLARCLGEEREPVRREILDRAAPILARYAPERLGAVLEAILAGASRADRGENPAILFVLDTGAALPAVEGPLREAVAAGRPCEVLVTPGAILENEGIRDLLIETDILPRVCDRAEDLRIGALHGIGTVVLGEAEGPLAARLAKLAPAAGCRLLSAADPEPGAFAGGVRPPAAASVPEPSEWMVVAPWDDAGGDLDVLCRTLGARLAGATVVAAPEWLPGGRRHLFADPALLAAVLTKYPDALAGSGAVVWCGRPPSGATATIAAEADALRRAAGIVFAAEADRRAWLDLGLDPVRTVVVPGAADPALFRGHARGGGAVGLLSPFAERERPDLVLELVRRMPGRRFLVGGSGWRQYALFEEMRASANVVWRPVPPEGRAALLAEVDVLLAPSGGEGAPLLLLEAMTANAVPVAGRRGSAPDLVRHGGNGFLFGEDASADEVAALLEAAFTLEADVRATVATYGWDNLARAFIAVEP